MFDRRLVQNFDWILLFLLILIVTISLTNLYSATYPIRDAGGDKIFSKQVYWFLMGFVVLFMVTFFDYHLLERGGYSIYVFSIILLIMVLIIGRVHSGSQRWLGIGGFVFQPSELAKISMVIILAKYFTNNSEFSDYRLRDLWQPFLLSAVPCVLIVKEPDLGSGLLLAIISFSIMLFMKIRWKSLFILVCTSLIAAYPLWRFVLKEYQQKRILNFLRPEMDPLGSGYHIIQSKIAVGSGLLWGKGFLKGTQTGLHFLPEQHTDFAFSVLAEEWGFAGVVFLLSVYLFLIFRIIFIAKNSKDRFGTIFSIGIASIIFWQLVINVCMTIGLMPVVGIPLPLLSYGGSSVVTTMLGIGILMNISMRRFMFQ
jgi:rod shape determining protein RodA